MTGEQARFDVSLRLAGGGNLLRHNSHKRLRFLVLSIDRCSKFALFQILSMPSFLLIPDSPGPKSKNITINDIFNVFNGYESAGVDSVCSSTDRKEMDHRFITR